EATRAQDYADARRAERRGPHAPPDVSKDPIIMLRPALDEAGAKIGVRLLREAGKLQLAASRR
ncbi:MAG: hypothetical protein ACREH8_02805, partial [Opitutaceae bacterium]